MKLPIYNRLLRKYREYAWSTERMTTEAAKLSNKLYDAIDAEEVIIHPVKGLLIILGKYDEDKENVLSIIQLDLLSSSAHIMCNESGDYLGIGRTVKKVLDTMKFHVYYEDKPIVIINGIVACGLENVMNLQLKAGNFAVSKEKTNETIH